MMGSRTRCAAEKLLFSGIAFCLLTGGCAGSALAAPGPEEAERVAREYARAIDYDFEEPEKIYAFLTGEYQAEMTEEEFTEAFLKERSYPYLTPLFLYFDRVELSEDLQTGTAWYTRAARLPGMTYEVGLVYDEEQETYAILDFEEFTDGSYLEKFETLGYDLSSYFDMNALD